MRGGDMMFGYVVVDKPSLRIREYDYYRATYCGLCHSMGKCTGCASRLTLSYDMTFFALLREMLEGNTVEFEKKRCVLHPVKSVNTVKINPQLEYCAYIGGILCSGKIVDNINDEQGAKKHLAKACRLFFSKMERESVNALPDISSFISEKLDELSRIEKQRTQSIDIPADIFGEIMSCALSYGFEGEKKLIAENIGKRIGRWIYIVDAFDDYAKDRKSGSYNPFVELYGGKDFSSDNLLSISKMLEAELAIACAAIDLVDDEDLNRAEIIKNILCLGMPSAVKKVCNKQK